MRPSFDSIIAELAKSDDLLQSTKLAQLSNMEESEFLLFKQTWTGIEANRRRQIIYRLIELAEDNLELSFDRILKFCFKDPDEEVKIKAIEGIWENEEPSLILPLINLLQNDRSERVQSAAALGLGKFALLAEHQKLRSCHVANLQTTLLAMINDNSRPAEVRRRALEAIAPLNLPEVKELIKQAHASSNQKLVVSSIYAMGRNYSPDWLPILIKDLSSPDAEIRYEAAGACGELEQEEAVPHLKKLITDTDVDVQMAAVVALGKIGGPKAKEFLERCARSSSLAISDAAQEALAELRAKDDMLSFRV